MRLKTIAACDDASPTYPTPLAEETNQLHQVDAVGPLYLKGKRQRYYLFVAKDVFDGAVCLRIYRSRKMEIVLDFLGCTAGPQLCF